MSRRDPFKRHRFSQDIILLAVRWYCRYPLSYQDVVDLLEERGVEVDRSTIFRWVQKFGPEIAKRAEKHLRRASLDGVESGRGQDSTLRTSFSPQTL